MSTFFSSHNLRKPNVLCLLNVYFFYFTTSNFLPNLRAILKFLFHDHPDVIHTNFASLGLLAIFKKYVFKIPFIFTSHGIPPQQLMTVKQREAVSSIQ
jgi:hypothetical protein